MKIDRLHLFSTTLLTLLEFMELRLKYSVHSSRFDVYVVVLIIVRKIPTWQNMAKLRDMGFSC